MTARGGDHAGQGTTGADGSNAMLASLGSVLQPLMEELQCQRASLWIFEVRDTERSLRCVVHKYAGQPFVHDTAVLPESAYRDYFAALVASGIFVSSDAGNDPTLVTLRGPYLRAHHITALLDLPISINGRAFGIVCCEQTDGLRTWATSEIRAARRLVSRAALVLAGDPAIRLDMLDSVPIAPFQ